MSALESLFQQTEQDFEIIVCDDGSADSTPLMMSEFTDRRIRYLRHSHHIGKSNNMRSGFLEARGQYFLKLDDDDRLRPEFLERTSAVLDRDATIDFVSTDHWIIDSHNTLDEAATKLNSQRWGRIDLSAGLVENLLERVFLQQSLQLGATLFRKSALQAVGFMRPNLQNCEDNDLLVRLALAEKRCYYLPELLMEYRVHEEQQGIKRSIPYLRDKLSYLTHYEFEDKLELVRLQRIQETELILGLRLIEAGETATGQQMIWAGKSFSPMKAWVGLALSLLPKEVRCKAFNQLRQWQHKNESA